MMLRNRTISCLLLFVSMVMLTARLLPHHHHWGEFCMALCEFDAEGHEHCHHFPDETGQDGRHHGETECCDACVTNFLCPPPAAGYGNEEMMPDVISLDFLDSFTEYLLLEEQLLQGVFGYIERFPMDVIRGSMPLRAPPFDC